MAKKKKDDIEDNDDINQESQGDLNEADDNFGLPDVDYEPIDRTSSSDDDDTHQDEPEQSDYVVGETQEEEYQQEYSEEYNEPEPEQKEYIPGSYTPPKDDSIAPKIIALIVILLLAGVGIWYFGFYRQQQQAEQARIEQQQQERARQQEADAEAERQKQAELEAQRRAAAEQVVEEEAPKEGTIQTISSRTGRYYVVVASNIDDDLAMDYAKERQTEGVSTFIIEPYGTTKFHRIAVSDHGSWNEAQSEADNLKGQYGDGVWVIKY